MAGGKKQEPKKSRGGSSKSAASEPVAKPKRNYVRKAPKPRDTWFCDAMGELFIELFTEQNLTTAQIADTRGFPKRHTLYLCGRDPNHPFKRFWDAAHALKAAMMVEELLSAHADVCDKASAERAKILSTNLRWVMEKTLPKQFGHLVGKDLEAEPGTGGEVIIIGGSTESASVVEKYE